MRLRLLGTGTPTPSLKRMCSGYVVEIGDDVLVFAEAFIGPGVRVGDNAVVGARAVVVKDVADGIVVAGNPARKIGDRFPGDEVAGGTACRSPS